MLLCGESFIRSVSYFSVTAKCLNWVKVKCLPLWIYVLLALQLPHCRTWLGYHDNLTVTDGVKSDESSP